MKDELVLPPDAVALGLLPVDVVPALGLADALVLDEAGEFFDGLTVALAPERGAERMSKRSSS